MDFSFLAGFQLDDSTVGVIAMLGGMYGGYWIHGRMEQMKAKRAKVPSRAAQRPPRS